MNGSAPKTRRNGEFAHAGAVYPLSPMQQGMLFNTLYDPSRGVDFEQLVISLDEDVDPSSLRRAWQQVTDRHSALRTSFLLDDTRPLQKAHSRFDLSWQEHDLRGLDQDEQNERLEQFLIEDRTLGFDLKAAPLMRLNLFRTNEASYRLVWSFHHAILDGRSIVLVAKEAFACYEALREGRDFEQDDPLPFADFIQWFENQDFTDAEAYWRSALAGSEGATHLANSLASEDRGDGSDFSVLHARLPRGLTEGLLSLAKRHEITPNTILQGAWAVLLSRYTGKKDVIFGVTRACRKSSVRGTDSMVGLLINTLPLRVQVADETNVLSRLQQIRAANVEVRPYEHTPLSLIQRCREEESSEALFDSLFVFENFSFDSAIRAGDPHGAHRRFDLREKTNFPITINAYLEDELVLKIGYYRNKIGDRFAAAIPGHLQTVLKAIVADPSQRIADLPLLTEGERRQLLVDWNDNGTDYPRGECLHTLFEEQAQRTPNATAVVFQDQTLTYAELNTRANQLAHHLMKQGVGPETLVGVCMERSLSMLVGMLGILKAGGAYVPMDPAYPAERLAYMVSESQAPVILTQSRLVDHLTGTSAQKALLGDENGFLKESAANPSIPVKGGNLAYVIYTSGSTGRPKGVALTHGSAAALLCWAQGVFSQEELAGVLGSTSICFDLSVFELFLPLSVGGSVILAQNALELPTLPAREKVTLINTVPSAISELHRLGGIPSSVQTINLAGEPLTPDMVDRLYGLGVGKVYDLYGPSEDTTYSTWSLRRAGGRATIGRPIANTQAYILDDRMRPVPLGVSGELYLGGEGLARGYFGRSEATAEKFVPDPFSQEGGGRLYRTGDLARYYGNGDIEFLGRIDHQVKVRGFRIELGEIESVLKSYVGVKECVVIAREDAEGDKRLVAYVVGKGREELSASALHDHICAKLPEYMAPSAIVFLKALPLTPNGKLDRKALPAPGETDVIRRSAYVAPRTPVEHTLAEIWRDVLRVDQVGATDNFFDLGGHSLLATQVVTRVRKSLGADLSVRALFESPTIGQLAASVMSARGEKAGEETQIARVSREAPLPLSFSQQSLWIIDQLTPDSPVYNSPFALRLTGPIDVAFLQKSIDEIVCRHEALRTVFTTVDGRPVQVIHDAAPTSLPVTDLRDYPAKTREKEALRLTELEAQQPFDLVQGPLFRCGLLKLDDNEHILLLTFYHAIFDGWSFRIFLRELHAVYGSLLAGVLSPLPDLPIQYADYAVWQRERLSGETLGRLLSYWKKHLAGAPALLELPTDRPRPALQTFHGGQKLFELPAGLTQALRDLGRQEGVTLFMTLLAAFQVLLGRYSGQDDIVIGTPAAGRTREEVEGLIGFFVNTLAQRGDLSGDPTFRELLSRVRETALGAFAHQDLPFEKLVEELQPERSLSHAPVFQVMFSLQNGSEMIRLNDVQVEPIRTEGTTSKFDLLLDMSEMSDTLVGYLEYNTDLFDPDRMERMLGHFQTLLEGIVANPNERICRLPLLTEPERHQIVLEWNDSKADYPKDRCIHTLFEEQAARTPDAIAVDFGDRSLTYSQLNARSNQLAHYLKKQGVGRETLVGLCLERSVEMIVALLGVLKAGGAYLPIETSYPAERVSFMLQDGRPALLLSHSSHAERLKEYALQVVCLDDLSFCREESEADLHSQASPENIAYVMYTSGSTGIPKGIEIPHRGVVRLVKNTNYCDFNPSETILQFAPLAFDASTVEIWGCLLNGARLVVFDGPTASLEELGDTISKKGVSTLWLTASLFQAMVENRLESLKNVRQLLAGGDVLSAPHVARVVRAYPGCRMINGYGPTENTSFTCCYTVPTSSELSGQIPIGRPVSHTQVYILDQQMKPVPVGVPGELYTGGAGLARGYLNRPELTAEKFVPNPFGEEPGGRLYRTGDLCRYLPDGNVEFLGRLDHQVKIRGFRIELGEIESVLLTHAGVKEAVILAREDTPGEKRLVGYVVCGGADELSANSLREYIGSKLPDYMVPWTFVFLESLPLNANGKVDRKSLPQPTATHDFDFGYVAPRSPIEEGLAQIWQEVLKVGEVGVYDSFFDLGGHSILATQVISRIRDTFQVELPLLALFEAPTVAGLAERISGASTEVSADAPALIRVDRQGALPLSFAQRRLWYIYRLDPENPAYNVPCIVKLEGPLCREALGKALDQLVERHEILRTAYLEQDGEPMQIVSPASPVPIEMVDLSGSPLQDRESRAMDLVFEKARVPFDLETGPALRAALFSLEEQKHLLLLTTHHITSDGWSHGVIAKELAALYTAALNDDPDPIPELAIQYSDYAVWQREWMETEGMQRQVAYWKDHLEGAPAAIELPFDRLRPSIQSLRGTSLEAKLDIATTETLQTLCRQQNVTIFMLLLACFSALLSCNGSGEDIVVGTDAAGRNHSDLEGLVGFFVNHLVLRTDLSDNPSFVELLSRVRRVALDAYAHQEIPFDRLVEVVRPERNAAYAPVFQVLFVMQSPPTPPVREGDLVLTAKDAYIHTSKYDLEFFFAKVEEEGASRIEILWVYNTDVFEASTVKRIARQFEDLVGLVVARPELSLSGIADELSAADLARRKSEQNLKEAAQRAKFQSFKPKAATTSSLSLEEDR